jgi:hypothetical protein
MAKSQVYSWRVASDTKAELERAARRANQSLAALLDRIVREWLDAARSDGAEAAEQKRLHDAAAKSIGVLRGGDPHRAEHARRTIRARLASRHAHRRSD